MVIKTYLKTLFRMFKKHATRIISLTFIVLISVGFCSGIGSVSDKINSSLTRYYKSNIVSDYIIKSTSQNGLLKQDVDKLSEIFPDSKINTGNSIDIKCGEKRSVRYYFVDFDNWTVNVPDFIEGKKAENKNQIYVERSDNVIKNIDLGAEIEIDFANILKKSSEQSGKPIDKNFSAMLNGLTNEKVSVCAIVQSPLTFAKDGEPSYNNNNAEIPDTTTGTSDMDCLEYVYYISSDLIPTMNDLSPVLPKTPIIPTGDAYVAISDRSVFDNFSSAYKNVIQKGEDGIKEALNDAEVITLYDNYSFKSLHSYSGKVEAIGFVLILAFLIVTGLVALSNMTRLIEEERSQIACLKTLGYSSTIIVSKYLLFALMATGIGGIGAYFVGLGLAYLLYYVFGYSFNMPPVTSEVAIWFYIVTFVLIVGITLIATLIAGYKITSAKPAVLLRPKPPRAGKKVILERIPILWNRLSFKYKSTMRNVLRYKSRFLMTVIAVAFSTALVMAGLALVDLCLFHNFGSGAIMAISAVIVIFAGLLTAVVIYTITNINISERNREIATLMVLGYQNKEVAGYIYREIYINSFIGILLGFPVSALLVWIVFLTMGVGKLAEVSWFMWFIAPVIVIAFTSLVTLLLFKKITGVDMNESLKAIE